MNQKHEVLKDLAGLEVVEEYKNYFMLIAWDSRPGSLTRLSARHFVPVTQG